MKASPVLNKAGTQKAPTKTNESKKVEKVETNQKDKIAVKTDKAGNPIKAEKISLMTDKAGNPIKTEKIETGQKLAPKVENNKISKAGSNEKKVIYKNEDGD